MQTISNADQEMMDLLEKIVGIKNELLYIREHFQPLLRGDIYLSVEQVCALLHVSKRTLQQYRDDGLIPYIKLQRKILFRHSDVLSVLDENYRPAKKDS